MAGTMAEKENSPLGIRIALLVTFGGLYGAIIALGRVAVAHGLQPPVMVFWQALGPALLLGALAVIKGHPPVLKWRHQRYYLLSALTSMVVPNYLSFTVVNKVGAAITGLAYALSPLTTYCLALIVGVELFRPGRFFGVILGLAGAAIISMDGNSIGTAPEWLYLLLAFSIPFVLGCGNIYRALDWPPGAHSTEIAAGAMIVSAIVMLPLALPHGLLPADADATALYALLAIVVLTSIGYIVYFELQRRAKPVFFSQISYVIVLSTLLLGVSFLDERLNMATSIAIPVILVGVYFANRQSR